MYEIRDKIVLITGAANGIGASTVKELVNEGAKKIIILDIAETVGNKLADELNDKTNDKTVIFFKCDITNDDDLNEAFKAIVEEHKHIHVVINNAGIMNDGEYAYKKEIALNVTALITLSLKGLKHMRTDEGGKGGTIINTSSVSALMQAPFVPIYSATKAAVLQFSNCLGDKTTFNRTGVRVVVVCYGGTGTSLVDSKNWDCIDKEMKRSYQDRLNTIIHQSPESASKGLIEVYKRAESGSTWVIIEDKPAKNITSKVKIAYQKLNVFE